MPVALLLLFDWASDSEVREDTVARAGALNDAEGFIWKLWLRDLPQRRGGGIYLFTDRQAATRWVEANITPFSWDWLSNLHVEILDIDTELTSINHLILSRASG